MPGKRGKRSHCAHKKSSQSFFAQVPDVNIDNTGVSQILNRITVTSATSLREALPVSQAMYDSQLLFHPGSRECPLLFYAGKLWTPIFTIYWKSEGRDELTVARLHRGAGDSSAVVASFTKTDPRSSRTALLLAAGLFSLSQSLKQRLILRIIRLRKHAESLSPLTQLKCFFRKHVPGMPPTSMKYIKTLSTVASCVVDTLAVEQTDKTALAMMRFMGYCVAGRSKIGVVPFRNEEEFEQVISSSDIKDVKPTISRSTPSSFSSLKRQLAYLNASYGAGVLALSEQSDFYLPLDGRGSVGLEMEGLVHKNGLSPRARTEGVQLSSQLRSTGRISCELGTIQEESDDDEAVELQNSLLV